MKSLRSTLQILSLVLVSHSLGAFRPISVEPDTELALSGFDVVSYHLAEEPVKGHPNFQIEWSGANWRFSSQTNMRLFRRDPEKYVPEFGGYCASGMASGGTEVHACNPTVYIIQEGRLIVFSSKSQLESWKRDPEGAFREGSETYRALLSESTQVASTSESEG
ncbi:MAG: YHS domain-containing (seleno)protein [Verrucomicrobiota bacterium]